MKPDNKHLARNTDPETSKAAAESLDLRISKKHERLLGIVEHFVQATDDQIAEYAVGCKITERHEQARRLLRTLRERTDYLEPVLCENGEQLKLVNDSGRQALAWGLSHSGRMALRGW